MWKLRKAPTRRFKAIGPVRVRQFKVPKPKLFEAIRPTKPVAPIGSVYYWKAALRRKRAAW